MCGLNPKSGSATSTESAAGMGLTGLGTLFGMSSVSDSYDSQIATANANAQLAAQQLYQTGIAGADSANAQREKGIQMIASQRAGYGASGIDVNTGSALNVQASTAQTAEQNAQKVLYNTTLAQWSLSNEEMQYQQQAKNLEAAKNNAEASTLLTGLTKLASQYASYASTT